MKTVTVEVTAADIELARRASREEESVYCRRCVVAVAVGRYFETGCEVGFSSVYVDGGLAYSLDEVGKELRKAFDDERWDDVQPCTITLSVKQ